MEVTAYMRNQEQRCSNEITSANSNLQNKLSIRKETLSAFVLSITHRTAVSVAVRLLLLVSVVYLSLEALASYEDQRLHCRRRNTT
jgi:hypothetical protein